MGHYSQGSEGWGPGPSRAALAQLELGYAAMSIERALVIGILVILFLVLLGYLL